MIHENSRKWFNPRSENSVDRIQQAREKLNKPYTSEDSLGEPLTVAGMVDAHVAEHGLATSLPTGLADRVAKLASVSATELSINERNLICRLGGVAVTRDNNKHGRFDIGSIPVNDGSKRVVQQSPQVIARLVPRLLSDIVQLPDQSPDQILSNFVVRTIQKAEAAQPVDGPDNFEG